MRTVFKRYFCIGIDTSIGEDIDMDTQMVTVDASELENRNSRT